MTQPSVSVRAATQGVYFGIYLTVISLISILSGHVGILSMLPTLLLVLIPVILYKLMRKMVDASSAKTTFSTLWMFGILLFAFGSLICGLLTYCYLQFIEPDYMVRSLEYVVETLQGETSQQAEEMVNAINTMIDKHLVPKPIDFVIFMLWLTMLVGSLLSMLMSGIVLAMHRKTAPPQQ